MEKGYVHLYTGNGKGKTTAALGLTLRAAGWGISSVIIQFMKGQPYGELESVKCVKGLIRIEQYGSPEFCQPEESKMEEHRKLAGRGLKRAKEVLRSGEFGIIVLDEIITAMRFELIRAEDILSLIRDKRPSTELVLTGRGATEEVIAACDLVTEMKEVRHYFNNEVEARKGVEY